MLKDQYIVWAGRRDAHPPNKVLDSDHPPTRLPSFLLSFLLTEYLYLPSFWRKEEGRKERREEGKKEERKEKGRVEGRKEEGRVEGRKEEGMEVQMNEGRKKEGIKKEGREE